MRKHVVWQVILVLALVGAAAWVIYVAVQDVDRDGACRAVCEEAHLYAAGRGGDACFCRQAIVRKPAPWLRGGARRMTGCRWN